MIAWLDYSKVNVAESGLRFPFYHKPDYLINSARLGSNRPELSLPSCDTARTFSRRKRSTGVVINRVVIRSVRLG